jgi:tripartite ATP-independent transporter DctP family solute receptor
MKTKAKLTIAATAAALCLASAGVAQATEFRLGTIVPSGHAWNDAARAFAAAVAEDSGGAHTVEIFPSGQLGSEEQMVQQLQTGALDMAFLTIADVSNRISAFGSLYTPFLVADTAQAAKILNGPTAQGLLDRLPQEMGVVGVGYGLATMRQMMATDPVGDLSDLEGLKMRITPFKPFRDFYDLLGIAPTPMPLPDVYDALANGQVDAMDIDVELVVNFKFYERAEHLLLTNHSMFPMVGLVSGRVWAGLSDADKEMIATNMKQSLDDLMTHYVSAEPELIEQIRATGIEVRNVDPAFFGDVIARGDGVWVEQKDVIDALRSEAEQF